MKYAPLSVLSVKHVTSVQKYHDNHDKNSLVTALPLIGSTTLSNLGWPTTAVAMLSLSILTFETLSRYIQNTDISENVGGSNFQLNVELDTKQQHNWNKSTRKNFDQDTS